MQHLNAEDHVHKKPFPHSGGGGGGGGGEETRGCKSKI